MEKQRSGSSIGSVVVFAIATGLVCIAVLGPHHETQAQGQYYHPIITPPFNNPISNPLDVTKVIPGQEGVVNPAINALGTDIGGPAIGGVSSPSTFPSVENLKGPTDFILVQGEKETKFTRESPYLVALEQGTVLASVRKPSNVGMIKTMLGTVAFSSNSDAFITFENGALRIKNVDGTGQTIKVRVASGPLAGKVFAVAPGYELVVADHKLTRTDLRPSDGILRRQSQTFADGYAGISQYHVHSALMQSGVVGQLSASQASNNMSRRVIGDMSRMAAVLNHVQGTAGYSR